MCGFLFAVILLSLSYYQREDHGCRRHDEELLFSLVFLGIGRRGALFSFQSDFEAAEFLRMRTQWNGYHHHHINTLTFPGLGIRFSIFVIAC